MNIYQRLNEIKKKIGYVQKDKAVEQYKAVTHDQVTAHIRQHFIAEGVMVIPSEVESTVVLTGTQTKGGTPIIRFEASYYINFVNIDDPQDRCVCQLTAHANDTGDKAPGKALSYATKYACLKVLQLETGDDEEGRIPEEKRVDAALHLDAINKATDLPALKVAYTTAIKECSKLHDLEAHKALTAAKDARKIELSPKESPEVAK